MRRVIYVDGTSKDLPEKTSFDKLKEEAGIEYAEVVRRVYDGRHHMLVDEDAGLRGNIPINDQATRMAGRRILGNVVIIPAQDRIV